MIMAWKLLNYQILMNTYSYKILDLNESQTETVYLSDPQHTHLINNYLVLSINSSSTFIIDVCHATFIYKSTSPWWKSIKHKSYSVLVLSRFTLRPAMLLLFSGLPTALNNIFCTLHILCSNKLVLRCEFPKWGPCVPYGFYHMSAKFIKLFWQGWV